MLSAFQSLEVLAQERTKFVIAYSSDWSPISYGIGSEVDGILPRLMDRIFTGYDEIELVHQGLPWKRAQAAFYQGHVAGMITTPTKKRLASSTRSLQIAIEIPFQPIVRRGGETKERLLQTKHLRALKYLRFCDVLGNGWAEEFYGEKGIKFSVAPTIEQCLKQLSLNRVDVVIHARPVLEVAKVRLGLDLDLEIVDRTVDGGHKFPLLVTKEFAGSKELLAYFDEKVSQLKESGRYLDIMNELIDDEKEKAQLSISFD